MFVNSIQSSFKNNQVAFGKVRTSPKQNRPDTAPCGDCGDPNHKKGGTVKK